MISCENVVDITSLCLKMLINPTGQNLLIRPKKY